MFHIILILFKCSILNRLRRGNFGRSEKVIAKVPKLINYADLNEILKKIP